MEHLVPHCHPPPPPPEQTSELRWHSLRNQVRVVYFIGLCKNLGQERLGAAGASEAH